LAKTCRACPSSQSLGSDGEADHLHILLEYPPKLSVSVLVHAFKSTSSRRLRRNRPDIASRYRDGVLWSPAYFAASAGGAPIIEQYVEQQSQRFLLAQSQRTRLATLKIW
jgi:putative transposase